MKKIFANTFRRFGWLHFDFLVQRHDALPERLPDDPGTMVFVESGLVKKWACMSCPGGCGEIISLSLNPNKRPRWTVLIDFWQRPTINPSVHQQNACGCHFWIKNGQVHWCKGGRPKATASQL